MRSNGSELRRLTNDLHKDRVPIWSRDGERVVFYSNRSGQWEYWSIRIDGSGLKQLTDLTEVNDGVWSPDGQELIVSREQTELWRFRLDRLARKETATRLTLPAEANGFLTLAWSASGEIAGVRAGDDRRALAFGVWNVKTNAYRSFDVKPIDRTSRVFGLIGGWLHDSRRFIAESSEGVIVLDAADGGWRVLLPNQPRDLLRLSQDGRSLLVEREVLDSDIWMLER
jgi:WD40 repeat protein